MFHPNHPTYAYGKTAKDFKLTPTFISKISDDSDDLDISGWDEDDYGVRASDPYKGYGVEKTTTVDMIKVFTDQSFGLRAREGGHTTFAVYENGAVYGTISRGCHAMLQDVATNCKFYEVKLKELWVSLWAPDDKLDEATVYWNYMLDPKISPWRGCLKGSEIIYAEHPTDKRFKKRPVAFVIRDMDAPFQLIGSLCITSRMCWQQSGYLTGFTALIKGGFSIPEAAFLTANIYLSGKGDKFKFPYAGDYPFDTYVHHNMDYQRFVNGDPIITKATSVHKGETYNKTNNIFGAWIHHPDKVTDTSLFTLVKDCVSYPYIGGPAVYKDRKVIPTEVQRLVSKQVSATSRFGKIAGSEGAWEGLPLAEAIDNLKKNEGVWKNGKAC